MRVPVENLVGGVEGKGLQQVLGALETGRINVAARALGNAQRAYDEALKYSRERHAFGEPISDFQAIQMKLADMATKIQAARLLVWWAASEADKGESVAMQAGMAKLFASRGRRRGRARVDAHPRRLRLLEGVRRRAPLPRGAAVGHR